MDVNLQVHYKIQPFKTTGTSANLVTEGSLHKCWIHFVFVLFTEKVFVPEYMCIHSVSEETLYTSGKTLFKLNYIAINKYKFHCFTVHFDSLSFIHTNSCTFHTTMYQSFKLY